jgi:addiction module RelE/StbE family toxin
MKLEFNPQSLQSLVSIKAYIEQDSHAAASRVAAKIVDAALRLKQFPLLGRTGKKAGTRALVVPGLPYIIAYRVLDEVILIDAVIHTSRRWPAKNKQTAST